MNIAGRVLCFFLLQFAATAALHAQATRTWVSGVGDDANPCSRTAPCKTFAGAISKTAASGEIDVLDPGGFGTVTITKSITIDGSGGSIGSVLAAGTTGINVNDSASGAPGSVIVILRNLSINGAGNGTHGINFTSGKSLRVENCKIFRFNGLSTSEGINFAPSTNGVIASLSVGNTDIRNNTEGGIYIHPTGGAKADVFLNDTTIENNGRGVRIEDGSTAIARNTVVSTSTNNGFTVIPNTVASFLSIEGGGSIMNSSFGVFAGSLGTVRLSNTLITQNPAGISTSGTGAIISFGNNRISGNTTDGAPTSTIAQK